MSDETTGAESAATIPGRAPGWTPGNPGGTDTVNAPVPEDGPPTVVDGPALASPPPVVPPPPAAPANTPADDDIDDEATTAPPPVVPAPRTASPPPPRQATVTVTRTRSPWTALVLLALLLFALLWGWWLFNRPHPDLTAKKVAEIGSLVDGYSVHPGSFRDHRGTLMVDGSGREIRCQQLDADVSGTLRGVRASCIEVSAPR